MGERKRLTASAMVAVLLAMSLLSAGCGGGEGSATATTSGVPTVKEVTRCVSEGGGGTGAESPSTPPGFPANAELVGLFGQEGDDVVVYLSHRPVFSQKIAQGFKLAHEYPGAKILLGGRALVLYLPKYLSPAEGELVVGCVVE
jgi:hypothetical protein